MNRKKSLGRLLLVLAFVLMIWGAVRVYDLTVRRMPVSESQIQLARSGVTSNHAWTPVIRQFNSMDWALVPTGCFRMGSTEAQLDSALAACKVYGGEQCPYVFDLQANQVCFEEPYWIGLTEVTNRQYGSSSSTDMVTMYRGPNWPRETVTWQEADAYCASLGARLPTEAEWEYAARGPDELLYPWGNEISVDYQEQANRLNPEDVDSVPADVSWVGALGMAGNVMEWVSDSFDPASTLAENIPDTSGKALHLARGGSWASYANFLLRATQRIPHETDYASSVLGFRCVQEFNP